MSNVNETISVLDQGCVTLLDVLGTDETPAQIARSSYANFDKEFTKEQNYALNDYLLRHRHTSPFEFITLRFQFKMPIFVARQFVRHRTAVCVTGDTVISFDLPGGKTTGSKYRHHPMTMKEIWRKWQPTTAKYPQGNALYLRQQLQKMCLRTLNVETGQVEHTTIKNVVNNGIQAVVRVELENGRYLRATPDHLVYTNKGWLPLEKAYNEKTLFAVSSKTKAKYPDPVEFSLKELNSEVWKPINGYEDLYEVSNLGRVRSWVYTREEIGKRKTPIIKKPTVSKATAGYPTVSLSKNGVSLAKQVHKLVLSAFVGEKPEGLQVRHLNSIKSDCRLSNLQYGSVNENNQDRMEAQGHQRLSWEYVRAISIQQDGEEEVFDIEVESENHNFFANGIVVHNCNEVSARYTVLEDNYYVPDASRMQKKATNNKQGSSTEEVTDASICVNDVRRACRDSFNEYDLLLASELAPELARIVLPLSTYTEFVWQVNMHNLLHLLGLRMDSHAQYEIRVYADAMFELTKKHFPNIIASWENHVFNAVTFSRDELTVMTVIPQAEWRQSSLLTSSRQKEFIAKLDKAGL